jgi:hypothetical protein
MWEPRPLTPLWAFTACYRDSFTFFFFTKVALTGKHTGHASYNKPRWFTLIIKCIYYNSSIYIFNTELLKLQKRWGLMIRCWSVSGSRQYTGINFLLIKIVRSNQTRPLACEVEPKMTYYSDASALEASSSLPIGWIGTGFLTFAWNVRIPLDKLKKVTSSYVMHFHIWKPSGPGSTSTGCIHLLTLVLRSRIFLPWRWRRYVPPKRRFTQDLHGATSQKTAFLQCAGT